MTHLDDSPDGQMRFRDLAIGDSFDFVDDRPERRMLNSFWARCKKESARTYSWQALTGDRLTVRVGSINAEVFHVVRFA